MTRVEENFLNFFGDTNFISEVSKSKFGIEKRVPKGLQQSNLKKIPSRYFWILII